MAASSSTLGATLLFTAQSSNSVISSHRGRLCRPTFPALPGRDPAGAPHFARLEDSAVSIETQSAPKDAPYRAATRGSFARFCRSVRDTFGIEVR